MATTRFGWSSFFLRFAFAFLLVAASYNPEGLSYFHWVLRQLPEITAFKALAGVVLVVGWVIYLRATLRSLGPIGLVLALAVFGCLVWLLIDVGLVNTESARALRWLGIFVVSGVMAVGISWSHVRRRLTGQIDADDVDEN